MSRDNDGSSEVATVRESRVKANGIDFACLEAGEGPLVLCMHGFPDTGDLWSLSLSGAPNSAHWMTPNVDRV